MKKATSLPSEKILSTVKNAMGASDNGHPLFIVAYFIIQTASILPQSVIMSNLLSCTIVQDSQVE